MAHILKFKAPDASGILLHNTRTGHTPEHPHSNEKIDPTRTHLNYELQDGAGFPRYKARLTELHCMQRADVTTLDCLVVTLPKDVKKGDERAFFESCYAFAQQDYGKENIVNATVHMDETTPHIHIGFVPVVHGKRRNGEECDKVCHSSLITRRYYQQLHPRLSDYIEEDLGYKVEILNGATLGGNKTKLEMEIEELQRRLQELTDLLAEKDRQLAKKEEEEKEKQRIVEEQQRKIEELQKTIEAMHEKESRLQRRALEYDDVEPKGRFETQKHYDERRAEQALRVGVRHADEDNARREQNNANEKQRLSDERADFEEWRDNEERRIKAKNEETARKAANIDGEIMSAAADMNRKLSEKVDSLTVELANANDEISDLSAKLADANKTIWSQEDEIYKLRFGEQEQEQSYGGLSR